MNFNVYNINKKGIVFQSFEILENQKLLYHVKKSGIISSTFIIESSNHTEVLRIKKSFSVFKMNFEILRGNEKIAFIEKENRILKQKLVVSTKDMPLDVIGNFGRNDYTILRGEEEIAKVSRNAMQWTNYFGVAIKEGEDALLIFGIVMALQLKIQTQNKSR